MYTALPAWRCRWKDEMWKGQTSGQVRVVNQKHWVWEMVEMPTRTPRSLHIMRSVPGASGTPSGNVATPLHANDDLNTAA